MPPRPRFTREQIVDAALGLVSEEGIEHLTARELAKRLGTSPQPIFTVFEDMKQLRGAVIAAAAERFQAYVAQAQQYTHPFKQSGMQTIMFAEEEPKLYQLLLMSESDQPVSFEEMFARHGGDSKDFIAFIMSTYGLTREQAGALFQHVWIYTYGIGALVAARMCTFTEEELLTKLGVDFQAMLNYIKDGHLADETRVPEAIGQGSPAL